MRRSFFVHQHRSMCRPPKEPQCEKGGCRHIRTIRIECDSVAAVCSQLNMFDLVQSDGGGAFSGRHITYKWQIWLFSLLLTVGMSGMKRTTCLRWNSSALRKSRPTPPNEFMNSKWIDASNWTKNRIGFDATQRCCVLAINHSDVDGH